MKKVFFLALMAISFNLVNAQCSDCATKQVAPKIAEFVPEVFSPVQIDQKGNGVGYGTAYLEEVPVNSSSMLTAYIYMYDASNNTLSKMTISGTMYPRPSHWPSTFFRNFDEKTLLYNTRKAVSFRMEFIENKRYINFTGL